MVRERLLDVAEELFAEKGFHGTSVRDITEHAGMRLAAVNYHFGTKEELFRDVMLRRAEDLNRDRLRRLCAIPKSGSVAKRVEAVVRSFVEPVLDRAVESAGFRNYAALVAQVSSSRLWVLLLVADPINAVALEYVKELGHAFPAAGQPALHHAYQLMLSSTLYTFSDNLRLDSLTRGALHSNDFRSLSESLVTFVTAGILAVCRDVRASPRSAQRPGEPG